MRGSFLGSSLNSWNPKKIRDPFDKDTDVVAMVVIDLRVETSDQCWRKVLKQERRANFGIVKSQKGLELYYPISILWQCNRRNGLAYNWRTFRSGGSNYKSRRRRPMPFVLRMILMYGLRRLLFFKDVGKRQSVLQRTKLEQGVALFNDFC